MKAKSKALVWQDIPQWKDDRCPFLNLPVEILDKVSVVSVVRTYALPVMACLDQQYLISLGGNHTFPALRVDQFL
jgi:hypothetical protein